MTGLMTVLLNVGKSALDHDAVGVAVHAVAPLLLIVTAETSLAYRKAIAGALAAREAAEKAERAERHRLAEQARQQEREERAAAAEAAARAERERREFDAAQVREQREHELRMWREQQAEQARRETAQRDESARREAAERSERARREQAASEREHRERLAAEQARAALLSAAPATERLPEDRAREIVQAAVAAGLPQRTAAELTGWSTGWIATRYQELRTTTPKTLALAGAGSEETS
ncbi:DUF2637 domain-containing protein [Kitasatospora sp. MBT63]|uniref:DUF2637 domain-containing protein n=1 Tax=Kitasatospora sp. MBT63 TaxID=1444768 RepID=UPI0034CDD926